MSERQETATTTWIVEVVDVAGQRSFFGPFVDEQAAYDWGVFTLDPDRYEPEDWDYHEVTSPERYDGPGGAA